MSPVTSTALSIILALASCSSALRKSAAQSESSEHASNHARIGCPVLAALTHAGHLKPDSAGLIKGTNVRDALMETGCKKEMSGFQADGIVSYKKNDVYQVNRSQVPFSSLNFLIPKYVNLYTMNTVDQCDGKKGRTSAGFPCNNNVQFQQHGYSTLLRDPSSGTAEQRFAEWFNPVLERISGVSGRVLTKAGFGRLLARARGRDGDHSAEFSLTGSEGFSGSNMQKYHPETKSGDRLALSQWQAALAWSGFWVAFTRTKNGVDYMSESDLRSFFISGQFPSGWQKRTWGFESAIDFMISLKGTGIGDEAIAKFKNLKEETRCLFNGRFGCENELLINIAKMLGPRGGLSGTKHLSNPPI